MLNRLNTKLKKEGITPKELADAIFKDKPNTNRILEKLQIKGLINSYSYTIVGGSNNWNRKR
ncbi:hypothetical protein SAMN05660297_02309 [Natronincola peptidivorans]|uniref:Uncharacterized protein n=1 Tax=Natronincola peptidivorans TaxID=426128 RepID=A0A1I0E856_9FIRM|nr:helix-turn-helix domain-containing protein [Natronincola peptidivorans]SET40856.1 hypothetical protein SAMN05660297_02309 [Natronincola peptidivorans]